MSSLTWDIAHRHGVTHVVFRGEIDEHADLDPLFVQLVGRVVFLLGRLREEDGDVCRLADVVALGEIDSKLPD